MSCSPLHHALHVATGCLILTLPAAPAWGAAQQWEGTITFEGRGFTAPGSLSSAEPTLTVQVRNEALFGWSSSSVGVWLRVDPLNRDRIRIDARDISWYGAAGDLDLAVGFRRVFWGVLESAHLVDVVNQRDPDMRWPGHQTLSQPMVGATWSSGRSALEIYLLPWTRPRPFAGRRGRLWSNHPVDGSIYRYSESSLLRHLSWAARWSISAAAWDVGITYFGGTSRDPRFEPSGPAHAPHSLIPTYDRVHQFGGDVQYTGSSWLWKFEVITTDPASQRYLALGSGMEYAPVDYLSLFLEVLWDSRGTLATTSLEHDAFAGVRLLFQDGSVVGGTSIDLESGNVIGSVQATRRFGGNLAAAIEIRWFAGRELREPRHALLEETSISLFLQRYF